jgi:glyoxylase-like metal-dependent hydrolase (beta-lactamase superfamily II)
MTVKKFSTTSHFLLGSLIVGIAIAALMAAFAPYVYGEFDAALGHGAIVGPKPTGAVAGHWVDDYFVVEPIDSTTFAIGEPRYYQGNYSYLIVGSTRAVLFDAGTGTRDITPVVRSLTALPVTVTPSHLHYDHVGALGHFDSTALIDDPTLRARIKNSQLTLGRYEFLGFYDHLDSPTFRVDEWWAPGTTVDLGDRRLRVLSTPGHTPTSVALYDEARRQLFLGDFMYPGELYAFLPAASRSAYLTTTQRLLATLGPNTRLYTAHMQDAPAPVRAPVLEMADLKALEATLEAIQKGQLSSRGFYPRIYPVRGPITFATGWSWNNQ